MAAQTNAAPVIIKRKKIIVGGGHHGGAWKVAYADFVTAMMAFFMLMWLLNATTEQQRQGIADYFSPVVPISAVSGGGTGMFGGGDVFSQRVLPQNGTGASAVYVAAKVADEGSSGGDGDTAQFEAVEELLLAKGGESEVADSALQHIVTRVTNEALHIELFSRPGAAIFERGTAQPTALLDGLLAVVADSIQSVPSPIALSAHMPSQPLVQRVNLNWTLSAQRADVAHKQLLASGVEGARFRHLTGHADRQLAQPNPMDVRNERIEVILLRAK